MKLVLDTAPGRFEAGRAPGAGFEDGLGCPALGHCHRPAEKQRREVTSVPVKLQSLSCKSGIWGAGMAIDVSVRNGKIGGFIRASCLL